MKVEMNDRALFTLLLIALLLLMGSKPGPKAAIQPLPEASSATPKLELRRRPGSRPAASMSATAQAKIDAYDNDAVNKAQGRFEYVRGA